MRLIFLFCLAASTIFAQKGFQTKSVSIFKNNSAFFVKSGNLSAPDGFAIIQNPPAALFGTLWFNSPAGDLRFLHSYLDTVRTAKVIAPQDVPSMLAANLGKKVRLHLAGDTAKIIGFVENIGQSPLIEPQWNGQRMLGGQYFTLRTTGGEWRFLNASTVTGLDFFEKPAGQADTLKTVKNIVRVDFLNKKKWQPLDLMYLETGLNWTPNYLIELLSEDRARVRLTAEVTNQAEDLADTDLRFVVGVPNFQFANRLSPFLTFAAAVGQMGLPPAIGDNRFMNAGALQSIAYGRMEADAMSVPPIQPIGQDLMAEISSVEDLYYYSLKNISLKKGANGIFDIFQTEVPIEHFYEANLPEVQPNEAIAQSFSFDNPPLKPVHTIKIFNKSPFVFTTGPALVVSGDFAAPKPVSQDKMNYTSIGGTSFLKLTETPDIQIRHADRETARTDKVFRQCSSCVWYDEVQAEGKVTLKNFKKEQVKLTVRRAIAGRVGKSDTKWQTADRIGQFIQANPVADVCWEIELAPGEERTILYEYQFYTNPRW